MPMGYNKTVSREAESCVLLGIPSFRFLESSWLNFPRVPLQ